jgi:hypothetical protein
VAVTGLIPETKTGDVPSLKTFVQSGKAQNHAPVGSGPEGNAGGPYFKTVLLLAEGPVPQNPQSRFAAAFRQDDTSLFKPFLKSLKAPVFKPPAIQRKLPGTVERPFLQNRLGLGRGNNSG